MNQWKDVAKFFSGVSAIEVLNHATLAMSNILPLHFFGIFISRTTNFIILIGWVIVFGLTTYYAWLKK